MDYANMIPLHYRKMGVRTRKRRFFNFQRDRHVPPLRIPSVSPALASCALHDAGETAIKVIIKRSIAPRARGNQRRGMAMRCLPREAVKQKEGGGKKKEEEREKRTPRARYRNRKRDEIGRARPAESLTRPTPRAGLRGGGFGGEGRERRQVSRIPPFSVCPALIPRASRARIPAGEKFGRAITSAAVPRSPAFTMSSPPAPRPLPVGPSRPAGSGLPSRRGGAVRLFVSLFVLLGTAPQVARRRRVLSRAAF